MGFWREGQRFLVSSRQISCPRTAGWLSLALQRAGPERAPASSSSVAGLRDDMDKTRKTLIDKIWSSFCQHKHVGRTREQECTYPRLHHNSLLLALQGKSGNPRQPTGIHHYGTVTIAPRSKSCLSDQIVNVPSDPLGAETTKKSGCTCRRRHRASGTRWLKRNCVKHAGTDETGMAGAKGKGDIGGPVPGKIWGSDFPWTQGA